MKNKNYFFNKEEFFNEEEIIEGLIPSFSSLIEEDGQYDRLFFEEN